MTLLASWIGVDSRKPASIYIVSDSRISWGQTAHFDYCQKVFGCQNHPDIFGYCGDALFPSIVLNQLVDIADHGLLFGEDWTCAQKFQAIIDKLIQSFNNYPTEVSGIIADTLEIIHCSRDHRLNFFCRKMKWVKSSNKWYGETFDFNDYSDKLCVVGSGAPEFLIKYKAYWESENQKTSRALFHCFSNTLTDIKDKYCGGAPQLVGLYRIGNARFYGMIHENKRFLYGVQIDNLNNFHKLEWRNELFEICDGYSKKVKPTSQRQPNPLR